MERLEPSSADDTDPPASPSALLIERLRTHLGQSREHGRGRAALILELARAAYRRLPASEVTALREDAVVTRLDSALDFMDARQPGTLAVRIFNAAGDGWVADGAVVEITAEDGPYLLSTATEELSRLGERPVQVLHPVLGVGRGAEGRLEAIVPARQAPHRESWISLRLVRPVDEGRAHVLRSHLERVLTDARRAALDASAMREQMRDVVFELRASAGARYPAEEVDEACALLDWMLDANVILLGYRAYDLTGHGGERVAAVRKGSGLGILSNEDASAYAEPVPLSTVAPSLRERMESGDLVVVSRTNRVSTVHRQERMLYLGVKKVTGDGVLSGERRFLGLFSDKAFGEPASTVPLLRRKLERVLEREDIVEGSHEERGLRAVYDALPKLELFQAGVAELRRTLTELMEAERRQDVRLLTRADPFRMSVSALVSLPRERFNADLRRKVQDLLAARYGATGVDYHLSISDRDQALLHFVLHLEGQRLPEVAVDELEREVLFLSRSWDDRLREALIGRNGREEGEALARTWLGRFPPAYQDTVSPAQAVEDVEQLRDLYEHGADVRMAVRHHPDDPPDHWRFKLFRHGPGVELSAFMPILESLGLVVVEEIPFQIAGPGGVVNLHDFGVRVPDVPTEIDADGSRLADAALAVWEGRAEADSLNRLVLVAGLDWDEIALLRAYRRYQRQVGTAFSEAYLDDALVAYPLVARALVELFSVRFDPDRPAGALVEEEAREQVLAACDQTELLDHDRILRGFLGLLDATVRTNRYREPDRQWLALKFDSAAVPGIPKPVPWTEIFVTSPGMEGIHLRGGLVARGGIRWSDRREDFRTEVLGLMKAQIVKNAVIVPTGSKGGFVVRPQGQEGVTAEAVGEAYDHYVRGLLDVTDNVEGPRIVTPPRVRARDGEDPYLVVAPDRGTASFSDLANKISEEYGFWLRDAFAAGGSRGYDHKAMGITAKGAWMAVRRHFRELDLDVQEDSITVAGIGDMSGDVFGNGMLQSGRIKLVAAFDHRHIFLDPDPDPAVSFAERRRLFELPGSTWTDYDPGRLSAGGGVWSRHAKEIVLSDEARALLRVQDASLSPPEVVRAILCAPVDLLFAGGIGTYVKAATESDAEVGDRANDALRIDANELRARVVGEGGNLAMTQRARIQYARRGGRCNTDAIDNSAGVDTSDREVNLKILLTMADGLAEDERDDVLASMTDEVAGLALRDVELQTLAISNELATSPAAMDDYEALMAVLELEEGPAKLDREVERLPGTEEMAQRRDAGAGLTRPELAVLLGYAKIDLTESLVSSPLVDDPALVTALAAAFPATAVTRYGSLLPRHRLRRQLIATVVANDLVNRMGTTYARRGARELGIGVTAVARAYWAAREVIGAEAHRERIESLDGVVDPEVQRALKADVDRVVDVSVRAYVREHLTDTGQADADLGATIARDRPAFAELEEAVRDLGSSRYRVALFARIDERTAAGVPEPVAAALTAVSELTFGLEAAAVARQLGRDVRDVADAFIRCSEALPLDELGTMLRDWEAHGEWERWELRGLTDDLRRVRRDAAATALAEGERPEQAVAVFLDHRVVAVKRVRELARRLRAEPSPSLASVSVVVRALREL